METRQIHSFNKSDQLSHEYSHGEVIMGFYASVFPEFDVKCTNCDYPDQSIEMQKRGIDRVCISKSGDFHYFTIEEKLRFGDADYNDVLVEIWSSYKQQVGWSVDKSKTSDKLLYAQMKHNWAMMCRYDEFRDLCTDNIETWQRMAKDNRRLLDERDSERKRRNVQNMRNEYKSNGFFTRNATSTRNDISWTTCNISVPIIVFRENLSSFEMRTLV